MGKSERQASDGEECERQADDGEECESQADDGEDQETDRRMMEKSERQANDGEERGRQTGNKPRLSGPCQRKICRLSCGHCWMCITQVLCPRLSVWCF